MPKRKRSSIRRTSRRRNMRARRIVRRRPYRRKPLALRQHAFVERAVAEHTMVIDTEAASTMFGETFSLSKIRQAATYAAIFEFYRIDKIVATFRYKATASPAGSVGPAQNAGAVNEANPLLYFKVDHNDIATQSVADMKDSMKTRTFQFTNDKPEFSIQLKPAIQDEMYRSSVTTAYTPKWGQWIPTADPSVPHYGLKAHACAFRNANWDPGNLVVSFKYYISFKNNE